MKYNWYIIPLFLAESAKEYFIVLIDAFRYQVCTIISLLCKSHLIIILNYNLSIITYDWIFDL